MKCNTYANVLNEISLLEEEDDMMFASATGPNPAKEDTVIAGTIDTPTCVAPYHNAHEATDPPRYNTKSRVGAARSVLFASSRESAESESINAPRNVPNATSMNAASVPA